MTARKRTRKMIVTFVLAALASTTVRAQEADSPAAVTAAYQEAGRLGASGQNFTAAATYFNVYTAPNASKYRDASLGLLTENLVLSGLPNAASYFFIKTLQTGNRGAIRRVTPYLPALLEAAGGDLLRKYVLRYTTEGDYDSKTKTHFFYFLGKDELLKGDPSKALSALSKVTSGSGVMAQAAYLRGAAYAMLNQNDNAISHFQACRKMAASAESRTKSMKNEYFDLEARCTAGLARAHYQSNNHDKAEDLYDEVPKASFVWTDILFEQAWNSYAKKDYNRALGKLVTYRSPALSFVFNPEVDVLRAQSYLALCLYDDVNSVVNEFNSSYATVGGQMKNFLVSHDADGDFGAFYGLAKQVYQRKLHTKDMLSKALNRSIRGPYFASVISQENAVRREYGRARGLAAQKRVQKFGNFLDKVIQWRAKTVRLLGGIYVKNSMYDLYQDLLADLDKMSFIKLEMLKQTKTQLERKPKLSEDENGEMKRGSADVDRRDYQYFWSFNGEFWADELGDYVFALESQCGR